MTIDTANVQLRLSSPSDIVEAVPYLIGFQPEGSFVVLSLRGKRNRLGLTARADLPSAEDADARAREFVGYLQRDHAARAVIVFYPPSSGPLHSSVQPLAKAMVAQLTRARIDVSDVLCVCDGRWWSLHCIEETCCPPEGTPISRSNPSAYAAAMTLHGRAVLGSRKELERILDPVIDMSRGAMEYALSRTHAQLTDQITAGLKVEVAAESLELFRVVIRHRLSTDPSARVDVALSVDNAARLIVSLDDVCVRDEILTWLDGEWGVAAHELFVELARRAPPQYQVPPLTVLAWIAYLQGNGAFAGIALDRALAIDSNYGLAQILDHALSNALNPDVFRPAMNTRPSHVSNRR